MQKKLTRSESLLPAGGTLLGWDKKTGAFYCNTEDTHTLAIGATRCGKTRCSVLETLCVLALAGESIIAVDPKSELFGYTCQFLRRLDYEVITVDFREPARSCLWFSMWILSAKAAPCGQPWPLRKLPPAKCGAASTPVP